MNTEIDLSLTKPEALAMVYDRIKELEDLRDSATDDEQIYLRLLRLSYVDDLITTNKQMMEIIRCDLIPMRVA